MDELNPNRLSHYLHALQETTTYFQIHPDILTLAVDNDQTDREFCQKLSEKGLSIKQDLPPLQDSQTKANWNDLVKQMEPSLTKVIQSV